MGAAWPRAAAALLAVVVILISSAKSQEDGACLYETGTALDLCGKYVFTSTGPVSNECCTYLRDLINDSKIDNTDDQCDCVGVVSIRLTGENDTKLEILNKECGVNITPGPIACEAIMRINPTQGDCNYAQSVIKSCNEYLTVKKEGPVSKECCTALRDFNVTVSGNTSTTAYRRDPCDCFDSYDGTCDALIFRLLGTCN